MNVFPWTLPGPTAIYLCLFVATLFIHFLFMSCVLAGTTWVLAGLLIPQRSSSQLRPLLKDWLPVMLSGAITAGVAPLLFLQILYRREFYTANLLQFHRWMAILPVLILLFYLLYVLKSLGEQRRALQTCVALVCSTCLLFIAWSWSGNHVLSLAGQDKWIQVSAGTASTDPMLVLCRLLIWVLTTLPIFSGWVLWMPGTLDLKPEELAVRIRRTASLALFGIFGSVAAIGLFLFHWRKDNNASDIDGCELWGFLLMAGVLLQLWGWSRRLRSNAVATTCRRSITTGVTLHLLSLMTLREAVRIHTLEQLNVLTHEDAAAAGGMGLFLLFCALNAGLGGWCLWIVRNGRRSAPEPSISVKDDALADE